MTWATPSTPPPTTEVCPRSKNGKSPLLRWATISLSIWLGTCAPRPKSTGWSRVPFSASLYDWRTPTRVVLSGRAIIGYRRGSAPSRCVVVSVRRSSQTNMKTILGTTKLATRVLVLIARRGEVWHGKSVRRVTTNVERPQIWKPAAGIHGRAGRWGGTGGTGKQRGKQASRTLRQLKDRFYGQQ